MRTITVSTLRHLPVATFPDAARLLVGFSGGKDSLVTLDLAVRAFGADKVVGYYMYLVRDMDLSAAIMRYARERWDVEVRPYPHFYLSHYIHDGMFCAPRQDVPKLKLVDIEWMAQYDTRTAWAAYGYRKQESLERRGMLTKDFPGGIAAKWGRVAPIAEWSRKDVLLYLKQHDIAIPSEIWSRCSNVNLQPASMYWLRQYWPDDYWRVLTVFPFAGLQADRHLQLEAAKVKAQTGKKRTCTADTNRKSAWRRGYDDAWQAIRAAHLVREPLCRFCAERGLTVAATEVDHIVPLTAGGTHDPSNLRSLCHACHSSRTAQDSPGGFHRARATRKV